MKQICIKVEIKYIITLTLLVIFFTPVFSLSKCIFSFSNIQTALGSEEWEGAGIEWYYENLTDEDRKKIRQAMDYSINRDQIIDVLMKGYAIPITTEIGQNMAGYDPSVQPREHKLLKAKELMAEVFKKTYDPELYISDPQHYTNETYFGITLMSPKINTIQTESAKLIAESFKEIGIDVELKWWDWNIIMPRIFDDPVGVGYNYEHGGFDALFIDFSTTPDPDYSNEYFIKSFALAGDNFQWIERSDVKEIINRSLISIDYKDRIDALQSFQEWFYEWVPKSIICQKQKLFVQSSNMSGLDLYNYGRTSWVHNITIQGEISPYTLNTSIPVNIIDFNPILSRSWYDSVFSSNIHLSLAQRRGTHNLSHAIPALAKSWTASADGLIWTVALREGIKFHDGSEVTANDVVFSYSAAMECPTSSWRGDMAIWFDSINDIKKINNYTIEFKLKQNYPYVTTQVFSLPILSETQMGSIAFEDWKTDGTNTGTIPLLGCGPYEFVEVDDIKTTKNVKSEYWDATLMGHDPNAVGGGIWWDYTDAPQNYNIKVINKQDAIYAIKNGMIDLLDPNTDFYNDIENLETNPNIKISWILEYGGSGLFYNHYDPRWGLNPHDPYDVYGWDRPPANYLNDPSFVLGYGIFFLLGYLILLLLIGRLGVQIISEKYKMNSNKE